MVRSNGRWTNGLKDALAANNRRVGVALLVGSVLALLLLRFWASPIARRITGQDPAGFVDFMGLPIFLALGTTGLLLFLWEPDRP